MGVKFCSDTFRAKRCSKLKENLKNQFYTFLSILTIVIYIFDYVFSQFYTEVVNNTFGGTGYEQQYKGKHTLRI